MRPRSISETWGARLTRTLALRLLCGAWLVPAASLIWIGLAPAGLRPADPVSLGLALGRTQATSVVLAVFTLLVGAIAFVAEHEPVDVVERGLGRHGSGWLRPHAVAAAVALAAAAVGAVVTPLTTLLWPVAVLGGLFAGLAVPRALLRCPEPSVGSLAPLATAVVFQLTIGWLHLANTAGAVSPILVAEGLLLAWAAAVAARVGSFAPLPETVETAMPAPAALSRGPARPSIPEAVAGR